MMGVKGPTARSIWPLEKVVSSALCGRLSAMAIIAMLAGLAAAVLIFCWSG
jgi:hypothetical protein